MKNSNDSYLELKNISKEFSSKNSWNPFIKRPAKEALKKVCFSIATGETLGIIGESGSGKTTLGKIILDLISVTSGEMIINGISSQQQDNYGKYVRRNCRMIFQSLDAAMNPNMNVLQIIREPLDIYTKLEASQKNKSVIELLELVNLNKKYTQKYPHELSGGEKRRISIARAIAVKPQLIIADEPVSALDVSIRSQVIQIFKNLKKEMGLTFIVISHDIDIIYQMANKVLVLQNGCVVEEVSKTDFFMSKVKSEYTNKLIKSSLAFGV